MSSIKAKTLLSAVDLALLAAVAGSLAAHAMLRRRAQRDVADSQGELFVLAGQESSAIGARRVGRRRLTLVVASMVSVVALFGAVTTVTFAKLSNTRTSGNNQFTSGTVKTGSPATSQACSLSNRFPGQTTSTATLNAAITSGNTVTTLTVTPLAKAVATNDKILVGQGINTQLFTASNSAAVGVTSITVTSATANNNYAVDVMVTDLTSQNTPCTFSITYTGSASAYVAADILVISNNGSATSLWDNTSAGLQLVVTDSANNTYTVPTSTVVCASGVGAQFGSVGASANTCGETDRDLLSTSTVSSGTSYTLSLNWLVPSTSPTGAQGGTAQIYVVFHAVQAGNNTISCASGPTVGRPCVASGGFAWS